MRMLLNPHLSWRQRLGRLRGTSIELDLRPYAAPLDEIHRLGRELHPLSDPELRARSTELTDEVSGAANPEGALDDLLPRAYALVRETARRVLGLHPYDVQLLTAVALHRGKVVEMQTGEGKTLAAVLPAYLNAFTGRGVHVLTFNDYLARRDAQWMGPVYRFLGLDAAFVEEGMAPAARRAAYAADVTYVTAKEAGFDHLRDLLAIHPEELVHRPFHLALVDEADSLLIDEARVPLVLAGDVERDASAAPRLAALAERLEAGVHFDVDEYGRNLELTEAGIDRAEAELGCANLFAEESYGLLTELHCALHARVLLRRDADYIVRGGRIELVDELTGRVADDRHWPDGLQAALEAKEGLERRRDGQILGSMTLQHFLTGYPCLCGMTGTAQDAAEELEEFYGLGVVVMPTHRPMIRADRTDLVFTHREAKEKALIDEICRVHADRRPILVGTLTVAESERLGARLRAAGIRCEILNAKNDAEEARIVAQAGHLGAVTISTNMAGRGTDIRLGGEDEHQHRQVAELGGLYVIGTNRHESRRVDLQLRGRAGRQGDPGESRFFLCLEDDLLERYGIRNLIPASLLPEKRGEPIDSPVVRREIARAQRIIEGQNLEIRRTLRRYAEPVEDQRRLLHGERQALLLGDKPSRWQTGSAHLPGLIDAVGEEAVRCAETTVTLFHIDRLWREHLAWIASLREGIHLVRLGGDDPLTKFQLRSAETFHQLRDDLDDSVLDALAHVTVRGDVLDLGGIGIKGSSSTWTYIISDDPFRQQLGSMLTGPGRTTFAIGAAMFAAPLLIAWALVDRFFRKRRGDCDRG